jgi:hypothetical protein
MSAHEQYAEDLALHAMDALPAAEKQALEQHLAGCPACRRELESLRGDAGLLALSVSGPAAPARSRERFTKAVAGERHPRTVRRRRSFFEFVPLLAAAAMVIISIVVWRENVQLRRRLDHAEARMAEDSVRMAKAREIVAMFNSPNVERYTLTAMNTTPKPHAKCMYEMKSGHLLLLASNLAPLPAGKTYQLWIIPMKSGDKPVPAGMFKPNASGDAMLMDPTIPAGVEAKNFAVTIEAEGGSTTPTMPIQMMGSGG